MRPVDYLFELLSAPTADALKAKMSESVVQKVGRRVSNGLEMGRSTAGRAARRVSAIASTASSAVQ